MAIFGNYIFVRLRGVNAWKTEQKIILLKKNRELMNVLNDFSFRYIWHFTLFISIYNFNVWNSSLPIQIFCSLNWEFISRSFFQYVWGRKLNVTVWWKDSDERRQEPLLEGKGKQVPSRAAHVSTGQAARLGHEIISEGPKVSSSR